MNDMDETNNKAPSLVEKFIRAIRRAIFYIVVRLYHFSTWLQKTSKHIAKKLSICLTTLITLISSVSIVLWSEKTCALWAENIWVNFDQTGFGLTIGALTATMLALVYSLSIIPAQRAADIFSPSILHLYGRDPVVLFVFIILSICILITVLTGTGWFFNLPPSYIFVIQFAALGIAIDCIRSFHQRTLRLLDPNFAAELLTRKIFRVARQANRATKVMAFISRIPFHNGQNEIDNDGRLAAMYRARPDLIQPINTGVEELFEMASKAITRREQRTVTTVVNCLVSIAIKYLSLRKGSDVFSLAAPEMVFSPLGSETDNVTHPIYERLNSINSEAISASLEHTSITVIRSLGYIAIHNLNITTSVRGVPSAPLAHMPLFYMKACAIEAGSNKMDDAVLEAIRQCVAIYRNIIPGIRTEDIDLEVIASLHTFALNAYARQSEVVANAATNGLLYIGLYHASNSPFQHTTLLSSIFDYIESLVPFALITQRIGGHSINSPFPAYSALSPHSLVTIISEAARHTEEYDPERQWIDLHGDFLTVADAAYSHLRKVADDNEFGSCMILHDLIDTVTKTISIFIHLYKQEYPDGYHVTDAVENKLQSFIHLYVWFFNDKKVANRHRAHEASRCLAYFAIYFLNNDKPHLAIECSKGIRGISNSIYASNAGKAPYTIADLLVEIWAVRLAVEVKEPALITAMDELLEPLDGDNGAPWEHVIEALERRKHQLEKRLEEHNYRSYRPYDPIPELRSILNTL